MSLTAKQERERLLRMTRRAVEAGDLATARAVAEDFPKVGRTDRWVTASGILRNAIYDAMCGEVGIPLGIYLTNAEKASR